MHHQQQRSLRSRISSSEPDPDTQSRTHAPEYATHPPPRVETSYLLRVHSDNIEATAHDRGRAHTTSITLTHRRTAPFPPQSRRHMPAQHQNHNNTVSPSPSREGVESESRHAPPTPALKVVNSKALIATESSSPKAQSVHGPESSPPGGPACKPSMSRLSTCKDPASKLSRPNCKPTTSTPAPSKAPTPKPSSSKAPDLMARGAIVSPLPATKSDQYVGPRRQTVRSDELRHLDVSFGTVRGGDHVRGWQGSGDSFPTTIGMTEVMLSGSGSGYRRSRWGD